jgi:hypothetical protein
MGSMSEIERLAREIRIEPGAAVDKRVLASAEEALAKSQAKKSAPSNKSPWRAVTGSRIAGIAAAVIIAAAAVGIAVLSGLDERAGEVMTETPGGAERELAADIARGDKMVLNVEKEPAMARDVDVELERIEEMYEVGDVEGLAAVLAEGPLESRITAAYYLAKTDGAGALDIEDRLNTTGAEGQVVNLLAAVGKIRDHIRVEEGESGSKTRIRESNTPGRGVGKERSGPRVVRVPGIGEESGDIGPAAIDENNEGASGGENLEQARQEAGIGPTLTEGVSHYGYYFDGEGDYINIEESESLDISGDQITISVWVKTERLDKRQVVVAKTGWGDNSWLIEIYPYGGGEARLTFYLIAGEPDLWSSSGGIWLKADTWYHLVCVYTGEEKRIYMNAVMDGRESVSGNIKTNDQPVRIGGWGDPIGRNETRYFNGVIDEVAIFARALSDVEIVRLYEGHGRVGGHEAGLVGYWSFNSDKGTAVVDGSRYHNDGELRDEPESYFAVHGWAKKPGAEAQPEPSYDDGGPTLDEGVSGYAYYFDGKGDYINIEESESLDISGDQITISAWIKPERIDRRQTIASKNWLVEINPIDCGDGRLNFFMVGEDTGEGNLCGGSAVSTDTWQHVVCVYTGEERIIYLNGAIDANRVGHGNIRPNDEPVTIGDWSSPEGSRRCFQGSIDEVAIFNRALSRDEVVRLYHNSGRLRGNEAGLVGYWNFDRDGEAVVLDSSAYQNHGEFRDEPEPHADDIYGGEPRLSWAKRSSWSPSSSAKPVGNTGAPPELTEGVSGYAYYFDGGGNCINIEESESLDITGRQITLSAWISAARIDRRQVVVAKTAGGDNTWIMEINPIDFKEGTICFYLDLPGFDYLGSSTLIVADRWYHVVMVYNETKRMIYIDGQRDAEQTLSGDIPLNDQPVRIGNWGSLDRAFTGAIDEVAIFNRALSDYEIGQLYSNSGRLRGNEAGLVGYWNFDRDEGDVVKDMSRYGNHGKLGGL